MYDWKIDENWEEDQKREGTARHKIFYIFFNSREHCRSPVHIKTVQRTIRLSIRRKSH